ncbi:hypothetical protein CABS01_05534 [Colletotrichum abscissum]|uniref:Secreted protein n=1 Tax=Colletotrichum abscissum TaxID=1671311 RepID=A0A9P9X1F1_9PEZI|nr:uncharacterized protein CABS01_05534 [Colletotrichum abscissum]KAI3531216.1 hypothetical protein CABS02_14230 [Colletotrichum abscissum]KAK1521029.1 hypothetical protein CABS01_05534 [Colletotrichum abscissum]
MKPTAFLTAMAIASSGVNADCFPNGMIGHYGTWLKQKVLALNADRLALACMAIAGSAKESFVGEESRTYCMQEADGLKWDFSIKNLNTGKRVLGQAECMSGLSKEAYGCYRGGKTSYWNWQYISDPNAGSCIGK